MDNGFVRCLDVFGDELTIVNAARVSFGKQKSEFQESDERLIAYLIRHQHFSPFRHVFFRFHIRAPEAVMRQWYKHVVGCEWGLSTNQLHGWNEISGRYVRIDDFFVPTEWRMQSKDKKQGSCGVVNDQTACAKVYADALDGVTRAYETLLEMGVATEQARLILPLSFYSETIWTASLQAVLHFIALRDEEHAQKEIRDYAKVIHDIVRERFPVTCRYWKE